jgi:hypothetical protein
MYMVSTRPWSFNLKSCSSKKYVPIIQKCPKKLLSPKQAFV